MSVYDCIARYEALNLCTFSFYWIPPYYIYNIEISIWKLFTWDIYMHYIYRGTSECNFLDIEICSKYWNRDFNHTYYVAHILYEIFFQLLDIYNYVI